MAEVKDTLCYDLFTLHEIQEVVRIHKNYEWFVIDYKITDYLQRKGQHRIGIVRLKVSCNHESGKEDLFYIVKYYSTEDFPPGSLIGQIYGHMFDMETYFLKEMLPKLNNKLSRYWKGNLCIPGCYHVIKKPTMRVMFLRDLCKDDFVMHDWRRPLDERHIKLIQIELAKLHFASRILFHEEGVTPENVKTRYPKLYNNIDYLQSLMTENGMDPLKITLERAKRLFTRIPEYSYVSSFLEAIEDPHKEWDKLLHTDEERFLVIRHGDLKSSHILFKNDENTGDPLLIAIIGFKNVSIGPSVLDMQGLIYPGIESQVLRKSTRKFLLCDYYNIYSTMCAQVPLTDCLPKELFQEFKDRLLYAVITLMSRLDFSFAVDELDIDFGKFYTPGSDHEEEVERCHETIVNTVVNHPNLMPRLLHILDALQFQQVFTKKNLFSQ